MRKLIKWISIAFGACLVLGLAASLLGGGGDKSKATATTTTQEVAVVAATEKPTERPKAAIKPVATAGPTDTPPSTSYGSGALGLTRGEWDQQHRFQSGDGTFNDYDNGKYSVVFQEDRVWHLERNYGDDQPTLATARAEMAQLIPADSQFVETYSPEGRPEAVVDLYTSASFAERFSAGTWTYADPGTFIVLYKVFDDRVARAIVAGDNNP